MLYYARTAPSIKARRAFTRVLVAFTVSEKRPTKVCGTRELRYMTKLCVCMSDFPSLEIYFVNTKQGENTIFVRNTIENREALKLLSVVENGALRKECYPFDG